MCVRLLRSAKHTYHTYQNASLFAQSAQFLTRNTDTMMFGAVLLILLRQSLAAFGDPIVHTNQAIFVGSTLSFDGKLVDRFLGIPYALPPVDKLRLKRPRPIHAHPSSSTTYQNATEWPNSCLQKSPWVPILEYQGRNFSEDCLYLNIWAPKRDKKGQMKSVLLYIHGGSFVLGSSSEKIYNALPLSALGDVVVVTINYR